MKVPEEPCQCPDCLRFYREHDRLIREFPTLRQQQEINWAALQSFRTLCGRVVEDLQKQLSSNSSPKSEDLKEIISKAKEIEENSNQILDFTKQVKNMEEEKKIKIIEALWQIIYSNNQADIYEQNLMRRLAGLLYIDSKTMGDIKGRLKKNLK